MDGQIERCGWCSVDLKSLLEQNKLYFIPPTSRMTNYVVLRFGYAKPELNVSFPLFHLIFHSCMWFWLILVGFNYLLRCSMFFFQLLLTKIFGDVCSHNSPVEEEYKTTKVLVGVT